MQQVKMSKSRERQIATCHAVSHFQQRLIVRLSVIRDENVKLAEMCCECSQHAAFFDVLAHEILANFETFACDLPNSNQERVCAASANQPRGLRVEKSPPLRSGG